MIPLSVGLHSAYKQVSLNKSSGILLFGNLASDVL